MHNGLSLHVKLVVPPLAVVSTAAHYLHAALNNHPLLMSVWLLVQVLHGHTEESINVVEVPRLVLFFTLVEMFLWCVREVVCLQLSLFTRVGGRDGTLYCSLSHFMLSTI